jgi:hypothetical protein
MSVVRRDCQFMSDIREFHPIISLEQRMVRGRMRSVNWSDPIRDNEAQFGEALERRICDVSEN